MKKSNIIITLILVVVSIFLLWLWFHLGFNHIDNPLDLVLSIIWWVIVVAAIALIVRAEKKRQEAVRTTFIAPESVFNSEAGTVELGEDTVETLAGILKELEYNFNKEDLPENANELFTTIVKSKVFKVKDEAQEQQQEQAAASDAAATAGDAGEAGEAAQAAAGEQAEQKDEIEWEGEVIDVETGESTEFKSREELEAILAKAA